MVNEEQGMEKIRNKFMEILTPCDCPEQSCLSNFNICKNAKELRERIFRIYRAVANARGYMVHDLVIAIHDDEERKKVSLRLAHEGENATTQFAAMDVLAMALILVPYDRQACPKQHLEDLRTAGRTIMENGYKVEVVPVMSLESSPGPTH